MEKRDKRLPLFHSENLFTCNARLAIVKKNATVLRKLVKDLRTVASKLGEIPALIIDDESDQASVNTTNPEKWKEGRVERTKINGLISDLLGLLPRAQYVGYTATPYANVFIDPSDTADIFPKDFLISLERPVGYMGVHEFHDLDSAVDPADQTFANSNEKAFVRSLTGDPIDDREDEIQNALDAFVLSGTLKLYREDHGHDHRLFRHHTMLVHESVKQAEHWDLSEDIRRLWKISGYEGPSGVDRLRSLYEQDFLPVMEARAAGAPIPGSFVDLRAYIGKAVARISEVNNNPVIVVNGDKDISEAIDFDRRGVWRILVGGTKLSRGFTIEGLTISYYRRRAKQADSLMQMGRWFGFRDGYGDLVRLYIGRREHEGSRTLDLYEAFDAIVQDEESFRSELRQYSTLVNGHPQVTPRDVPPLVSQHLPWLRPSAPNKMFNAQLVIRRSPGKFREPSAYPTNPGHLRRNYEAFAPIAARAQEMERFLVPAHRAASAGRSFEAFTGLVSHEDFGRAFAQIRWLSEN